MLKQLAILAGLSILLGHAAGADELRVGDTAPDFMLKGTDGQTYHLSDLVLERTVVLAWFPKAKTRGCTAECKSLKENGDALRHFEVAYFTASCDTPELNREFAQELMLDFPILSDPDRGTAAAYGVIDEAQKNPRRWTFYIGGDRKILAIDKQINTAEAGKDVAERLKALGIPEKK